MVKINVPHTIYIHSNACITVLVDILATEDTHIMVGILTMAVTLMEAILTMDTL